MKLALLLALLLLGVVEMDYWDAAMVDDTESADVTKMDGTDYPPKP